MKLFRGFGGWINQNTQQTLNVESKRSENVKSKSVSENDTNNAPAKKKKKKVYFDEAVEFKQGELWHDAEKKEPWYDAPPVVKVTRKKGLCHMNIEFTVGSSPDTVYYLLTNEAPLMDYEKWRALVENKSVEVLEEDGPREILKVKKAVAWDFLWWSVPIPVYLIVDENRKDLTAKYRKDKIMFLKVFEGSYKVEPLYVDSERLCKHKLPKNKEEYKACSGGQGKIASKVTMNQDVQPYYPLNIPPFSWYIYFITVKTTKSALIALQNRGTLLRRADRSALYSKTATEKHKKY